MNNFYKFSCIFLLMYLLNGCAAIGTAVSHHSLEMLCAKITEPLGR